MENSNKVDKYQGIIVLVLLMIVIIPAIILNTVDTVSYTHLNNNSNVYTTWKRKINTSI